MATPIGMLWSLAQLLGHQGMQGLRTLRGQDGQDDSGQPAGQGQGMLASIGHGLGQALGMGQQPQPAFPGLSAGQVGPDDLAAGTPATPGFAPQKRNSYPPDFSGQATSSPPPPPRPPAADVFKPSFSRTMGSILNGQSYDQAVDDQQSAD